MRNVSDKSCTENQNVNVCSINLFFEDRAVYTVEPDRPQMATYTNVSQTFFKWGPLSLVRMFYGPPYSWDYQTH